MVAVGLGLRLLDLERLLMGWERAVRVEVHNGRFREVVDGTYDGF